MQPIFALTFKSAFGVASQSTIRSFIVLHLHGIRFLCKANRIKFSYFGIDGTIPENDQRIPEK